MRLCLAAGPEAIRDPDAFRESIPPETFARWLAFESIEPSLGRRLDAVIRFLATFVVAQLDRGKDKVTLNDVLPPWLKADSRAVGGVVFSKDEVKAMFSAGKKKSRTKRANSDRTSGSVD